MKRTVEIVGVGIDGIQYRVTFEGVPCLQWPQLRSDYSSFSAGGPVSEGRDYYVQVHSRRFQDAAKAKSWLEELTLEVKQLAEREQYKVAEFTKLEGEAEV